MRRAALLLALLFILLPALCACEDGSAADVPELVMPETTAATKAQNETTPKKTSVGLAYYEEFYNPLLSDSRINSDFSRLVFDSLFTVDKTFLPVPSLCESYTLLEGVMTIKLRTGVKFTDGTPLSAADVVYSLKLVKNNAGSPYHSRLARVTDIAEGTDGSVIVTAREPCGGMPALLDIPVVKSGTAEPEAAADAVGCGRFAFRREGEDICYLQRNNAWWGSAAGIPVERIELIPVPDYDAMLFSYDSYDIDFINTDTVGTGSVNLTGASDMLRYDTTKLHYIGVNTRRAPFSDAAARLALSALIDRERLCSEELGSGVRPSASFIHPAFALYREPAKPETPPADLAKSFEGKTVVFIVNRENTYKSAAAKEIVRELGAAGIVCELQELEWADFVKALKAGDYDFYYASALFAPSMDLSALIASGGALNYGKYHSDEIAQLQNAFLAAEVTAAGPEAAALGDALAREMPVIPIGWQQDLFCIRSGLFSGAAPTQDDLFSNFAEWERLFGS